MIKKIIAIILITVFCQSVSAEELDCYNHQGLGVYSDGSYVQVVVWAGVYPETSYPYKRYIEFSYSSSTGQWSGPSYKFMYEFYFGYWCETGNWIINDVCDWIWENKDDYEDISVVDWACSVAALSESGVLAAILNSAEWPEGYTPTAEDWVKFTEDAVYDETGSLLKEASAPYESPDGVPTGGDPVYISNGEYGTSVTDFVVPGRGISVGITRTYGGRREYNGRFGYGWDMNYNMKVRRLSGDDDTVILLDGKGYRREYVFDSATGKYERSSDRSNYIVFDEADDTFALIDKAWTTYTFDVNGNLDSITDRNGNSITFEYDVAKSDIIGPSNYFLGTSQGVPSNDSRVVAREYKLTKIIDTLGRELSLTYNSNGLLEKISDYGFGTTVLREWAYSYDTQTNDLLTVSSPTIDVLNSSGQSVTASLVTTYTYTNHQLDSITDGKGQTYLVNEYVDGKVDKQVYGTGQSGTDDDKYIFDYDEDSSQTTVDERKEFTVNSNTYRPKTTTVFNDAGQTLRSTVHMDADVREDSETPVSYITDYEYNSNGNMTNVRFPNGNRTGFTYDGQGNMTSVSKGPYSDAFAFDGSTDYVEVADSDAYDFSETSDDFSVALWIQKARDDVRGCLIEKRGSNQYDVWAVEAGYNGEVYFYLGGNNVITDTGPINDNSWHFIVVTVDRDGYSTIYVDGKKNKDKSFTAQQVPITSNLIIGCSKKTEDFFEGKIDEVMIFNRVLSFDEIGNLSESSSGLVGYWDMDDDDSNQTVSSGIVSGYDGVTSPKNTSEMHSTGENSKDIGLKYTYQNNFASSTTDPLGNIMDYHYAYAMKFDGSNDYIDLPADTMEFIDTEVSISCWFKYESSYGPLVVLGASDSSDPGVRLNLYSSTSIRVALNDGSRFYPNASISIPATSAMDQGQWYHFVVTIDQDKCKLYLNGAYAGTNTYSGTSFEDGFGNSSLSAPSIGKLGNYLFEGSIDNVSVFDKVLSLSEIKYLYGGGYGTEYLEYMKNSCIAHWKMNENAANTNVVDSGGNGYDGTASKNTTAMHDYGICTGNLWEIVYPEVDVYGPLGYDETTNPAVYFTYNEYDQIETMKSPDGIVTHYEYYDETDYDYQNGRLKQVTLDYGTGDGNIVSVVYDYDEFGRATSTKQDNDGDAAPDDETLQVYNELDQLVSITTPLSGFTELKYDKNKKLAVAQAKFNTSDWQTTEFAYDLLDNLQTLTDALGNQTTKVYDDNDNVDLVTDAEDKDTTYVYDERDLLWKAFDAKGYNASPQYWTEYSYDDNGNLIQIEAGKTSTTAGQITRYEYDGYDRLIKTTYAYSTSDECYEELYYDAASNITCRKDRNGNTTYYKYDALNRLVEESLAVDNGDTSGNWLLDDSDTNCFAIDYLYNSTASDTYPFASMELFGNYPVYLWWPSGVTFSTNYLINSESPSSGNVTDQTANGGQWNLINSANEFSGTASVDLTVPGSGTAVADAVAFSVKNYYYDIAGRVVSIDDDGDITTFQYEDSFDAVNLGRLEQTTDQNSNTVIYDYYNNSMLSKLTYPDNSWITYDYDEMGRLTDISDLLGNVIAHYDYDELSRRTDLYYNYDGGDDNYNEANVDCRIWYDYEDRIVSPTLANAGSRLQWLCNDIDYDDTADIIFEYEYDAVGNRKELNINGSNDTYFYGYDDIYQLLGVSFPDNQTSIEDYGYDYLGNRDDYTPNALNQYTDTGFGYDNNGNLTNYNDGSNTWVYTYDHNNMLVKVVKDSVIVTEYTYDYAGRRISKTVGTTTTQYVYNADQVIAEYVGSNWVRKFIYGPGIDEPICMIVAAGQTGAGTYFYHYDGLGSIVALSKYNETLFYAEIVERYSYDAFGNTTITTTSGFTSPVNPYMFTGRRYDPETKLYHYRARMYSPELGRFMQTDPIGYTDGMNRYGYVGNNPVSFVDPMGLCKELYKPYNDGQLGIVIEIDIAAIKNRMIDVKRNKSLFDKLDNMSVGTGLPISAFWWDSHFFQVGHDQLYKYQNRIARGSEVNYFAMGMLMKHKGKKLHEAIGIVNKWKAGMKGIESVIEAIPFNGFEGEYEKPTNNELFFLALGFYSYDKPASKPVNSSNTYWSGTANMPLAYPK